MFQLPDIKPEQVLMYLRKSRTDDPALSAAETVARHEQMLDDFSMQTWGALVPEHNRFREVVSGETIAARPEMQKVLRLIEQPAYRAVLIVEPQRLSRGDLEDIGRISKTFRYTGTLVITKQGFFDLTDERDRDYFERELKRGNDYLEYSKKIMRAGRELSSEQGHYIGSIAPYGYERVFRREGQKRYPTLAIVPDEAEIVRLIFRLYAEGSGATRIADHLNTLGVLPKLGDRWTPYCIYPVLDNPVYVGKIKWGERRVVKSFEDGELRAHQPRDKSCPVYEGKHEAIVPDALWEAVRARRASSNAPRLKASASLQNPLSGLLWCSCGHAMRRRPYAGRCADRYQCPAQTYCGNATCTMDELHEAVIGVLRSAIADFQVQLDEGTDSSTVPRDERLRLLHARYAEAERKETALWEKFAEDGMPRRVLDELLAKVEQQKADIAALIAEAEVEAVPLDLAERSATFGEALDAFLDPAVSAARKNDLLKACIRRITYSRSRGERRKGSVGWDMPDIQLEVELLL